MTVDKAQRYGIPLGEGPFEVSESGVVTVKSDDAVGDDVLRVEAPEGYHQSSGDGYLLHIFAGDGTDVLNFDPSGRLNIQSAAEEGIISELALEGPTSGYSTDLRSGKENSTNDRLIIAAGGTAIFAVQGAGAVMIAQHAAPADNFLQNGQMALWFDQTNGAAKLMVKAKTANGTVVTGSLNLT